MMTGSWRPVSTVTSLQRLEDGGQNVLIDYGHGDIVNRSVTAPYSLHALTLTLTF